MSTLPQVTEIQIADVNLRLAVLDEVFRDSGVTVDADA
jgi:hypothetical protein